MAHWVNNYIKLISANEDILIDVENTIRAKNVITRFRLGPMERFFRDGNKIEESPNSENLYVREYKFDTKSVPALKFFMFLDKLTNKIPELTVEASWWSTHDWYDTAYVWLFDGAKYLVKETGLNSTFDEGRAERERDTDQYPAAGTILEYEDIAGLLKGGVWRVRVTLETLEEDYSHEFRLT